MATNASRELYPLSTNDSKAIPLDIIGPRDALLVRLAADVVSPVDLPDEFLLVSIYSTIDAVLDFTGLAAYPLGSGILVNSMILAAGVIYTVQLPNTGPVVLVPLNATEAGWCSIQDIQKWAGLGLQRQLTNR